MSYVVVATTSGRVRGMSAAGTVRFLGLPYGASTAGAHRFRPPRPVEPWTGVRDALEFGPSAPQVDVRAGTGPMGRRLLALLYPRAGHPTEGGPMSEDCLRLNVWTPAADAGARPVMVWFHGGAFQHGSGNEMAFNGDVLAAAEDVVVVTVTHRLGFLGFCALDAVAGESFDGSGVAGLLDLVQALEWVRDNVAAFGGDPGNVTVFGQSGGGMKVATLMAMPAAAGLFHRAIMQSGPGLRAAEPEEGAATARRLLGAAGLAPDSARELRGLELSDLMAVQERVISESFGDGGTGLDFLESPMTFGPTRHDRHLPGRLFGAGAPEQADGIPVMIGSTTHEMSMMLVDLPGLTELDDTAVASFLDGQVPDAAGLVKRYRAPFPDEPAHLLLARVASDRTFRGGSYQVADAKARQSAPVYTYLFDQPTEVLGGALGSCHSLEIPYVFGTVDRIPLVGRSGPVGEVSRLMMRAWARFARTGDPRHDGLPPWPTWDAGHRAMRFGAGAGVVDALGLAPLLQR
ncbi:MAG TPA: carboxylesterase family protein [Spirillospora sp.]|nr:carboxylesterase family protein [Spirillospora sp.]